MLRIKHPARLSKKRTPSFRRRSRSCLSGELRRLSEQMEEGFSALKQERIEEYARSQSCRSIIEELAVGPDHFLSGLRIQLNQKEADLFLCLVHREPGIDGSARFLSYREIGSHLGCKITKQAVAARVERLKQNHPKVWEYAKAIRHPKPVVPFSGISPSERDKNGIDKCYNYDMG